MIYGNHVNANREKIEHVPQFTGPFIKLKVFNFGRLAALQKSTRSYVALVSFPDPIY